MKVGLLLILVLALSAGQILAQQTGASIGRTNASALSFENAVTPYLNPDVQAKQSEVRLGKSLHARGPLIHLFHTRKPGEVPKRFWQLINPFSRSEAATETEVIHSPALSPRAWTTTAGWHPGISAAAWSMTHPEGGEIGLVSVGH